MKSRIINLDGIKVHTLEAGKGKPMIFLHGFPEFSFMWRKQLSHFSDRYHVIAPDMRGYNLSEKPVGLKHYEALRLAHDIKNLISEFEGPVVLVGHDWGGVIAFVVAHLYPSLIEKLIILNAPHPAIYQREIRHSEAQQKAAEYVLLLRSPIAEKVLARNNFEFLVGILNQRTTCSDAEINQYIKAWSQDGTLTSMLGYYRATNLPMIDSRTPEWELFEFMPDFDLESLNISVPTLVIWGEQDRALNIDCLSGLDDYVDDLSIERIPDCGHFLVQEQPERINIIIEEFL